MLTRILKSFFTNEPSAPPEPEPDVPLSAANCFIRPPREKVLYLDFDGVLHPGTRETFIFRADFEALMRHYPDVDIILTTEWRKGCTLDYLRGMFVEDIRERIVGATPVLDGPMARYREICEVNQRFGIHRWVAIDDWKPHFPDGCPNVVFVDGRYGLNRDDLQWLSKKLNQI